MLSAIDECRWCKPITKTCNRINKKSSRSPSDQEKRKSKVIDPSRGIHKAAMFGRPARVSRHEIEGVKEKRLEYSVAEDITDTPVLS